jgi:hypothetical protein
LKKLAAGLLSIAFLCSACETSMIRLGRRPPRLLKTARTPASNLPSGYQVKEKDGWLLSVSEGGDGDKSLGHCRISVTSRGFAVGTSADPDQITLKELSDSSDLERAEKLAALTSQGLGVGSNYFSDCGEGKSCEGRILAMAFEEFEGN